MKHLGLGANDPWMPYWNSAEARWMRGCYVTWMNHRCIWVSKLASAAKKPPRLPFNAVLRMTFTSGRHFVNEIGAEAVPGLRRTHVYEPLGG